MEYDTTMLDHMHMADDALCMYAVHMCRWDSQGVVLSSLTSNYLTAPLVHFRDAINNAELLLQHVHMQPLPNVLSMFIFDNMWVAACCRLLLVHLCIVLPLYIWGSKQTPTSPPQITWKC